MVGDGSFEENAAKTRKLDRELFPFEGGGGGESPGVAEMGGNLLKCLGR